MFKKINNSIFIILFLAVFFVPLLFTKWESGGVSEDENRTLAAFPDVIVDGSFNLSFTKDFETWFMDHMGFRQDMIDANKQLQKDIFDRSLTQSEYKIGKTGDLIYAPDSIIKDFAHANLWSDEALKDIGDSYQTVSDWLGEKGIPFYYVQCVDKHTIYPERFIASVKQIGTVSKTDQVMDYLQRNTTVNTVYFKSLFLEKRDEYDVFSHWGDPTHWTTRGSYLAYLHMMEQINQDMDQPVKVLQEDCYDIGIYQQIGPEGQTEDVEWMNIRNPKAQQQDVSAFGKWADDHRHSIWKNPEAGNDKRLLLMADSYFNNYLLDDLAESFGEVWLVWGDYTLDLPEIVEHCDPDLVIFEVAERVERNYAICNLASEMKGID